LRGGKWFASLCLISWKDIDCIIIRLFPNASLYTKTNIRDEYHSGVLGNLKYANLELDIHTVCFTDFDQGSKIIIFLSILTTFIASIVFIGHWGSSKIGLSSKLNHHKQIQLA
jgi:hypothetical protein